MILQPKKKRYIKIHKFRFKINKEMTDGQILSIIDTISDYIMMNGLNYYNDIEYERGKIGAAILSKIAMEDKMDEKCEILYSLLDRVWDDEDFQLGVIVQLDNMYALNKMIQYLEENQDVELDPSDVTKKALYIRYGDSIKHILED